MKILMTGMTSRQRRYRPNNFLFDMQNVVRNYAEMLGHTVDWREVTLGEDLSSYDLAIVALGPIHSLTTRKHAFQTLYVMRRLPCVLYADDWQLSQVAASMRVIENKLEKYAYKKVNNEWFYGIPGDEVMKYYAEFTYMASNFNKGRHKENGHRFLFPMFNWGEREHARNLFPHDEYTKFFDFDPSPELIKQEYVFEKEIDMLSKKQEWFLPTLLDHTKQVEKLNLSWPVHWIGHRTKTEIRVTEKEVFSMGENYKGFISPVYNHAGSGWYRTRFLLSAFNKCALLVGEKDASLLGGVFNVDSTFENFSQQQQVAIAEEQKRVILSYVKDSDFLLEQIRNVVAG